MRLVRRLLSIVLSLLIIMSGIPESVFAVESESIAESSNEESVVEAYNPSDDLSEFSIAPIPGKFGTDDNETSDKYSKGESNYSEDDILTNNEFEADVIDKESVEDSNMVSQEETNESEDVISRADWIHEVVSLFPKDE